MALAGSDMAAQRDPICEWREGFARHMFNLDFEPMPDTLFRSSFVPIFDALRIARSAFSPGFTFRDKDLVKDGDDAFGLVISGSRSLDITHQGRDLSLGLGDATLMHISATGSVGSRQNFGYIGMMIPHSEFEIRGARPDDTVMRRLPRRSEALQLLRSYVRSLERRRLGASAEVREAIRRHIVDLVALAITTHGAMGESSLSAVADARLSAALGHIAQSFDEPGLTVAVVARDQGISTRYLQRLIETTGTSFTARVSELRLQRAFTLLTEARDGACRISDIALQVGFSDISHFNRLFRTRFGDTPSGILGRGRRT